jgi:hypothetical protein
VLRNLVAGAAHFFAAPHCSKLGYEGGLMKKLQYQSQIFTQGSQNTTKNFLKFESSSLNNPGFGVSKELTTQRRVVT